MCSITDEYSPMCEDCEVRMARLAKLTGGIVSEWTCSRCGEQRFEVKPRRWSFWGSITGIDSGAAVVIVYLIAMCVAMTAAAIFGTK